MKRQSGCHEVNSFILRSLSKRDPPTSICKDTALFHRPVEWPRHETSRMTPGVKDLEGCGLANRRSRLVATIASMCTC